MLLVDLAARAGGAEVRVRDLATGLRRLGVPVTVACLAGAPLERELAAAGVPRVALDRWRGDPRIALDLRRLLRRHRPHVLDAHNVQSQLWAVLASLRSGGLARVATVHSEYRRSEGGPGRGWAYELVLRLVARAGWRFVPVSISVAEYLAALGVEPARSSTVWSAVNVLTAPPDRAAPEAVRAELGLDRDDVVAVCVARLVPAKDHETLLEAFAIATFAVPSLRLVVVGTGPEGARLHHRAVALGVDHRVSFLGHRDDVSRLLTASDLCVLSSRAEGLPYALLEAAAAGVPVVATRVGSVPQHFEDGVSALLVAPQDATALAVALMRAATHPTEMAVLAQRARRAVRAAGGVDAMVHRTLAAYGMPVMQSVGGAA